MRVRLFGVLLCATLLFASPLAALARQSSQGAVEGTVTDAAGGALAGARVYLMDARQALAAAGETDGAGHFRLESVAPGTYVLRIARKDFAARRVPVEVRTGQTATLAVKLEVEALAEQVTVTAEAGQVADARNTAQPVNLISEEEIIERAPEVVAQVVDEEQGVNLQRTSPSLSAVFVRGLTGRNVAVYVDGVRYTTSAQRGGVGTFFSLIEPSSLETVEILRGPNSSQYGSDVLGGVVNFISHAPAYGNEDGEWHGRTNVFYTSPTNGFGGNVLTTYGTRRYGMLLNLNARRINRLRPGAGLDTHAAVTRFLGIPSDVLGERLPDTAFTQYGGLLRTSFNLDEKTQVLFSYARNQQDGGRRYDQLAGGDGNLIADLRNLMTDLFYARLVRQNLGFFDSAQFTFSYNGQREERINQGGQGNPVGDITNQRERTNVLGFNFHVDKRLGEENTLTLGADVYRDKISAPAFTTNAVTRVATPSRPRIPNGARYLSYGFFAQDVFTAIPDRLRLSGALRYSVASYKSRAANAPVVGGRPLFPDDSARFDAFSGRVGAVVTVGGGFDIAGKYTRGFRAPNTTDLGIIGLVGTGFEVDAATAAQLGGFIGTTAGADAVSSGIPVTRLGPEKSDSFDLSLRYTHARFRAELTGFTNKLQDVYFDQALVLPPGAVGQFLGSERIVSQNARGLVFVAAATSPVLVRVNYDDARFNGVEFAHGRAPVARLHRPRQLHVHPRVQPAQRPAAERRGRRAAGHRLRQPPLPAAFHVALLRRALRDSGRAAEPPLVARPRRPPHGRGALAHADTELLPPRRVRARRDDAGGYGLRLGRRHSRLDGRDAGAGAEPSAAHRRDHQRRDRRQQRHGRPALSAPPGLRAGRRARRDSLRRALGDLLRLREHRRQAVPRD